jgi:hypothetical protein
MNVWQTTPLRNNESASEPGKCGSLRDADPQQSRNREVGRFERELFKDQALVDSILSRQDLFPSVSRDPERIIQCSPEKVDRALCRAIARAAAWGETWNIQIMEQQDV